MALSKNARVFKYVVKECSGLGTTRLLKLTYLTDVLGRQWLGRPVSELQYWWYTCGPFDRALYEGLEELESQHLILRDEVIYPNGYREKRITDVGEGADLDLDPQEQQLLDWVIDCFRKEPLDQLLEEIVYETPPMKYGVEGKRLPMDELDSREFDRSGFSIERLLRGESQADAGQTSDFGSVFERLRAEFHCAS